MKAKLALLLCILLLAAATTPSGQSPALYTTEPVVRIASPAADATVSGIVAVTVDAGAAVGLAGVALEVDGVTVGGEDTAAPWSLAWNADASGIGAHILTVVARDATGNAARSAVVPVVVGLSLPPSFPPIASHTLTAGADSLTSAGAGPVAFTGASLLANDSDPAGHAVYIAFVAPSGSAGGTIVSTGGDAYTYTPPAGFTGTDSFIYSIADDFGGTGTATVNAAVTAPPPAPSGLVLALDFDETSGTVAGDWSPSGLDGTVTGAQFVPGRRGNGLRFDGVDDLVTVDDAAALDLATGMTLAAWVQPTALGGWRTVLLKERADGLAYALYADDGSGQGGTAGPAGYLHAGSGDQAVRRTPASQLPLGTWTHLAVVFDGTGLRFHVNGALVGSRAQAGAITTSSGALRVGGNDMWGEYFRGVIDEVRVFNRALDAAEIAAEMNGAPAAPVSVAVPGVTGLTLTAAQAGIANASLSAGSVTNQSSAVPVGTVIGQQPAAGTVVAPGSPVSLVVSSGPAQVTVPTIVGLTQQAATTAISGVGLVVGSVTQQANVAAAGTVLSSTPIQGTPATVGSSVNLVVSSGPPAAPTMPAGLVAAFTFDAAGGTTATTAVNSVNAAFNGTVAGAAQVAGQAGFGQAMQFDGVDDVISITDVTGSPLDVTGGLTMSAWINPSTHGGGSGWKTIILKERGTGGLAYSLYSDDGAGQLQPAGYLNIGGIDRRAAAAPTLPLNTWTHVALTYDGANIRLYVNGVLRATAPQAGGVATSNNALRIGGNTVFAQEYFAGRLDDVRIYNRALSGAEITADRDARVQ